MRKYRPRESSIRSLGRKPTNRFSAYRHVTRSGRRSMPRLFVCCVLLCLGTLTSAQNTASALAQTSSTPVQVVYLTEGTTIVTYNVDPQTLSPCSCIWCACLHWVCCPRQPACYARSWICLVREYTNAFFGFSLPLPQETALHGFRQPLLP